MKEFFVEPLHIPQELYVGVDEQDLTVIEDNVHNAKGFPVFILLTGHCERGVDFRYV